MHLLAGVLLLSSLPLCPDCPPGCIPEALVEKEKPGVKPARFCPPGCTPIEKVKVLLDEPACGFGETEQTASEKARPARPENELSTSNRSVFLPNAASMPTGDLSMTGYALGLWDIEYAFNEHFQFGTYVVLPVWVAGAFPNIKLQTRISEHLAVGGGGFAGLAGLYAGEDAGSFVLVAGGHVEATLIYGAHMFNIGMVVLTAGVRPDGESLDMADGAILLPNLGYRFAFHPDWSFQAELIAPVMVGSDGAENDEPIFILIYGFRGHGEILFGDIGFCLPFFDEYIDEVWKYTPIGIPYFSVGLKF